MKQYFLQKNVRNLKWNKRGSGIFIILLAIFLLLISVFTYKVQYDRQVVFQQQLAEKVLRFHVLANSNSACDQALKLQVRDAIGGYIQENLAVAEDKEERKKAIAEQLTDIETIARETIIREGYDYNVTAKLTVCDFPVKTYGEYTFPAGTYEALQVVIGDGAGENWWCVLYPNMCFENSMYEVVDENAKEALREVLDKEEYEAVLTSGKYEIRFRLLEWFR